MKHFNGLYMKRAITVYILFTIMFIICGVRVLSIQNNSAVNKVAEMQFSRSITLAESRGYIYDRNFEPLVNEEKTSKRIVLSKGSDYISINNNILEEIKSGIFIALSENDTTDGNFEEFIDIKRYSENFLCRHIIGYTDAAGNGVSGIEKAFDKILKDASGELKINYKSDARGDLLIGDGIDIVNNNYNSVAGVVLTIDKNFQKISEDAINNSDIICGSVVVMDVNTFEILALVSSPVYSYDNLDLSLDDNNLPFLNRALCAYPAGSVIKPFVAVSALEKGINSNICFECNGYLDISGNNFRCYNFNKHGNVDLNKAIEKSCNTFFINLGLKTGAEKISDTLSNFGFGKEIKLCSTIISSSGNLPKNETIESDAQLANICFGQGELLVTPIQLAAAYSVLANGGSYKEPAILKALIDEKGYSYAEYRSEVDYKVTNNEICQIINNALYNNMLNGTGVNGASDAIYSAGKTATAQTGRYDDNGNEQLVTWFAGFFPFENPKYAVVILNEKGSTASIDCAPVFKYIIENINSFENKVG